MVLSPRGHFFQGRDGGELEALKRNFQRLSKQYEKSEEKLSEFRDKLRDVRAELASKERQLDVARRMLTRLGAEKNQLEMVTEQEKAAVKKLEHRLASSQDTSDLQAKLLRYKAKVSELRQELSEAEARLMLSETAALQQSQELHVLRGALGLKSELPDGALDNQAKLLHALAQSQEESTQLAMQLADNQRQAQEVQGLLVSARMEVEGLLQAQADKDRQLQALQRQLHEAVDDTGVFRRDAEEAKADLKRTQTLLEEALSSKARVDAQLRSTEAQLAGQLDKGRQLTERLQAMERSSRLSIEALRTEVSLAVERAESRSVEQRANWSVREASLMEQNAQLKQEQEKAQALHEAEQRDHAAELERLQGRVAMLQGEVSEARQAERQRLQEVGRLCGQIDTLTEFNAALKADLAAAEHELSLAAGRLQDVESALAAERQQLAQQRAQMELLQGQLQGKASEQGLQEAERQAQVRGLTSELAASTLLCDRLQAELQAAWQQQAATPAAPKSGSMERHIAELHQTVHALTQSKIKLQTSLLEQLNGFKAKLAQVEEENRHMRLALAALGRPTAAAKAHPSDGLQHGSSLRPSSACNSPATASNSPMAASHVSTGPGSAMFHRARTMQHMRGAFDDSDSESDEDDGGLGRLKHGHERCKAVLKPRTWT